MSGLRARAMALALLTTTGAGAQGSPPRVLPPVQVANCPDELANQLPSLAALEIDVLLRERGRTRVAPERVAIHCAGEAVLIEVVVAGERRASSIDLSALAADHRARALALATAELVDSLPAPVPEPPPKRAPAPAPTADAGAEPAQARGKRRPTLVAGALVEGLGRPAALLVGLRAVLHGPSLAFVVPSLSIDGATGGIEVRAARVALTTLSAGAHLTFGDSSGRVRWDAGPGVRFGWARLAGEPDAGANLEGRRLTAAWGGPEARARAAFGVLPDQAFLLALELGAGIVVLPVRGLRDGAERIYGVQGPWISLSAGAGVSL